MLNQKEINIVKSTAPVLEENGVLLTKHFYQKLFKNNPEVIPLFNKANMNKGTQPEALAGAICAYAKNIDNLEALGEAVKLISHKHFSLKVKPEHYPIVGSNLLESIKDVLGEAATDEIVNAWSKAYFFLADILIDAEKKLAESKNSFDGFKKFKISKVVKESENIKSFYLKPLDEILPEFKSGQYITIRVPYAGMTTMRNYSLSSFGNNDYLRISVKREDSRIDEPRGYVSNYLHENVSVYDEVEIGAPAGVFTLKERKSRSDVVFLAGGIGVTPLLAMLQEAHRSKNKFSSINFVHANQNENLQAFRDDIDKMVLENEHLTAEYFYDSLNREKKKNEYIGYINENYLSKFNKKSIFYICGSKVFMSSVIKQLRNLGVSEDNINFEFFGPLESI
tara:strand:+ start:1264 stop:2448 length:1185 start_codon:yes stop_codon:yes gene_type:complete